MAEIELWFDGNKILRLVHNPKNDWYFVNKPFDTTLWIAGHNRYWLLNNNFKKIGKVITLGRKQNG